MLCLSAVVAGCVNESDPPSIRVSETEMTLDWETHSIPVEVTSNAAWKATSNQPWCRPSVSSGRNSQKINILVDESGLTENRTAIITLQTTGADTDMATILVSQDGEDVWGRTK